jgi:hypothetical protein
VEAQARRAYRARAFQEAAETAVTDQASVPAGAGADSAAQGPVAEEASMTAETDRADSARAAITTKQNGSVSSRGWAND